MHIHINSEIVNLLIYVKISPAPSTENSIQNKTISYTSIEKIESACTSNSSS